MTLINSAVDADRNGRLFDLLPAGNYCGVGLNSICVDYDGRRNGAKGPSFKQTDMKFAYRFHPGRRPDNRREHGALQPVQHGELQQPGCAQ